MISFGLFKRIENRFWSKADIRGENDCWIWKGKKRPYGAIRLSREAGVMPAHRFALCLKLGRPLKGKEQALHKCDNPPCVNPRHLFLGTHAINMMDMGKKNRARKAKIIPDAQVLEIRLRYHAGEFQDSLAKEFGVPRRMIWGFIKGKRRKYVGGPVHLEDMRKSRSGGTR